MKCPWIVRAGLLAASSLVFSASATQAQDPDYSRVVRLSRADGQVLVSHPGGDGWEEALVNLPLQEGDTLTTQAGFAEIEFENGATAYLVENSVLRFEQLAFSGGGRVTQLNLTQGAGTFYATLTRQDSFRVITSTLDVSIPERGEFRVDAFRDSASVQVLLGDVSVSTSAGSATFEKGQSVAIHEGDLQNLNVARLPEPDSFDQWVSAQSETIQSGTKDTLSYISSPNYYGLSDLSIYGSWVDFPGYGDSWRPFRVGSRWTPYMNGNWILDPRLGWIWVSNEPWGWMPYHFGTWLLSPTLGWVWIPGGPSGLSQWQPACVYWVRAGKQIQSVTPLKQPPPEFASRPTPGTPRSGLVSTVRTIPQPSEADGAVVFDRGTRTFINGSRSIGPAVGAAAVSPQSSSRSDVQRVVIMPSGSMDSHGPRVILPPAGLAPTSRMPTNNANPPTNANSVPSAARTGGSPQSGPAAPPRPMNPPSPQPTRSVAPPAAPQAPASTPQASSVARPTGPTPESARPTAGAVMPRR